MMTLYLDSFIGSSGGCNRAQFSIRLAGMVSIKIVRPTLLWTISITYLMSRSITVIFGPNKSFTTEGVENPLRLRNR